MTQGIDQIDDLDARGMGPLRRVGRLGIGLAIMPREYQRQHDHRNDDEQHQAQRQKDQILLLRADVAFGIEQLKLVAATKGQQQWNEHAAARHCGEFTKHGGLSSDRRWDQLLARAPDPAQGSAQHDEAFAAPRAAPADTSR